MNPFDRKYLQIMSFYPDSDRNDYNLLEIEDSVKDILLKKIQGLEDSTDAILCTRGDHRADHDSFIRERLTYLFIVGEKAKTHIKELDFPFSQSNSRSDQMEEIRVLFRMCNTTLQRLGEYNKKINGQLEEKFLERIQYMTESQKVKIKYGLLVLLHNKGHKCDPDYLKGSVYISLAHGVKKYSTAKRFATQHADKGIVFVYILNKKFADYIKASELKSLLHDLGVNWLEDKHSEILLLNGMYPHYLLGFFEVSKNHYERFILNPWFYNTIMERPRSDLSQGVYVNQVNFHNYAYKMGYTSYVYHSPGDYNQFRSSLGRLDNNPVSTIRGNEPPDL